MSSIVRMLARARTQGAKRPTPTQSTCLYYDHDNEASKCVMHQPDFESIFPYLWGCLGCLDLIGGTSQTHCMVLRSRNLINHCSDSDLRIMGISRYMRRM